MKKKKPYRFIDKQKRNVQNEITTKETNSARSQIRKPQLSFVQNVQF